MYPPGRSANAPARPLAPRTRGGRTSSAARLRWPASQWLRRLQLTGSSSLIHLGKKHGKYFAQGQLKDVGSLPFKGIPGVDNLDGYFEVRDQSALLELRDENGFTVDFQNILKYLYGIALKSRAYWKIQKTTKA